MRTLCKPLHKTQHSTPAVNLSQILQLLRRLWLCYHFPEGNLPIVQSSGPIRAVISLRQEGKSEPHTQTQKQKLTYQFLGTSHRNFLSQSTTVASPFAGSSPITLLPARSRPENSMPSMHCCKAQLPGRTYASFTKEISLLKSLGQEFTTTEVPESWNPRDRKGAVYYAHSSQVTIVNFSLLRRVVKEDLVLLNLTLYP